jgi:hypothetical protein
MKSILKGLGVAFAGFMMIATLAIAIWSLVMVAFLNGYIAIAVFLGAISLLVLDGFVFYHIGKGDAYAKD